MPQPSVSADNSELRLDYSSYYVQLPSVRKIKYKAVSLVFHWLSCKQRNYISSVERSWIGCLLCLKKMKKKLSKHSTHVLDHAFHIRSEGLYHYKKAVPVHCYHLWQSHSCLKCIFFNFRCKMLSEDVVLVDR